MIGERFGRGTVIQEGVKVPSGKRILTGALLRCDCGTTYAARWDQLRDGKVKSCGCLRREAARKASRTHGFAKHPLYSSWRHLMRYNRNETVPEWRHAGAFIATCGLGPRPPGKRMSRIDPTKPYGPGTVEWIAPSEITRRGWQKRRTND